MRGKIILTLVLGILLIGIVSAVTTCCEKTTAGAWCQNVNDATLCEDSTNPITGQPYRAVSSFCEATSYCKLGTCINQQEGICISGAQIICQKEDGFWSEQLQDKLPQCKLGCCLVGDQAAFVTQVACNRMVSLYGLEVNFRADITNELTCLASANPGAEGACTYTKNGVTNCERTTRASCQDKQKNTPGDFSFHEGFLCSAQELETICAKSQKTICNGDDVYFVDTCGNLANIYDAGKVEDEPYWTLIKAPDCTVTKNEHGVINGGNTCGDCDYYSGTMCGDKGTQQVDYGSYMCNNLDCKDYTGFYSYKSNSNPYPKHGDTWCTTDNRNGGDVNSPGSSYFRLICYNGEVTTEECGNGESGATRQMICDQNETTRAGNCKANIWQDCTAQKSKGECEDINVRDCDWKEVGRGIDNQLIDSISFDGFGDLFVTVDPNNQASYRTKNFPFYAFSEQGLTDNSSVNGACVPKYSPGFERDGNDEVIGGESCSLASSYCQVTYAQSNWDSLWQDSNEKTPGFWRCVENCACVGLKGGELVPQVNVSKWSNMLNQICSQMGDCGVKPNYIGNWGVNTFKSSVSIKTCVEGGSKKCVFR